MVERSVRDRHKGARERTVWLSLAPGTQIAVDYDDAVSWTDDDFAALYLRHVVSAKRDEAETWAQRQVEERDAYLEGWGPNVERG